MTRKVRSWMWLAVVLATALICLPAEAQQPAAAAKGKPRKLAPGVMRSVDTARDLQESFSLHDVVELLAVDPNFDWAKNVTFRHNIWALQFEFKPVRMMHIDLPRKNGLMERKLIWYMVYSVTNRKIEEQELDLELNPNGTVRSDEAPPKYGWVEPFEAPDGMFKVRCLNKPIRFVPEFKLEGYRSLSEDDRTNIVYTDEVIPWAAMKIGWREDKNRTFYTTVEMCRTLEPGETRWGVVTWQNVDPLTDRFSVYVQGLTNAYKWTDEPGRYKVQRQAGQVVSRDPIGTGRRLSRKTLKLNFWRPGDELLEHEKEIRFGIPDQRGGPGGVDYEWVYR